MKAIPIFILIGLTFGLPAHSFANESLFQAGDLAAKEGRLIDMQIAYEKILEDQPDNVRALSGNAAALAWQGKYTAAQETYLRALQIEPTNVDLLNGLGYAYAWNGQYVFAHTRFRRVLRIDPANLSARKGIAYSYFWAGEHQLALGEFNAAQRLYSADAELAEASGYVSLALGETRDAIHFFDSALILEPGRESARRAKQSASISAPALEISTRFGTTQDAGSGLRGLEIGHWVTRSTRLGARYDDSLSLDNPALFRRGVSAPGYFVGVLHAFDGPWLASAEYGRRDHSGAGENLFTVQAAYRAKAGVLDFGATVGRHDAGYTDRRVHMGFGFPVGQRWRLQPVAYFAQSGIEDDREWRGVMNVEYKPDSFWNAGAYAGGGSVESADPQFDGETTTGGVWGSIVLYDRHSLTLTMRRETGPAATVNVAELGFTFRFHGN